jgi:hypothetical protein
MTVQALAVPARATGDIEPALESFARQPNGGLMTPAATNGSTCAAAGVQKAPGD